MSQANLDAALLLHQAARSGPVSQVTSLLAQPAHKRQINARDSRRRTPLHIAAEEGFKEKVAVLLQNGADPNLTDANDWTPLHCAASQGVASLELIEALLEKGANVNAQTREGSTALHYLSKAEDTRELYLTVQLLLQHGANPNLANTHGEIPLHTAVFRNRTQAVAALLEHGSHVNARSRANETPLHFAAKSGKAGMIRPLLDRGADPAIAGDFGTPARLAEAMPEVLAALSDTSSLPYLDITIQNIQANDLPKKTFGALDTCVVVRVDKYEQRSEVVRKESNPAYRLTVQISPEYPDDRALSERQLELEVRDGSEVIGACSTDLLTLASGPADHSFTLTDKTGKRKGRLSFSATVVARRRSSLLLRNVVVKNLRPASQPVAAGWKNDSVLELCMAPYLPVRTPVVYNTYEPSWRELPPVFLHCGLKELLAGSRKLRLQAMNVRKGETELLGECEIDIKRTMSAPGVLLSFREDLLFQGGVFGSVEGQLMLIHPPSLAQMEGGQHADDAISGAAPLTDQVYVPPIARGNRPPVFTMPEAASSSISPGAKLKASREATERLDAIRAAPSAKAAAQLADLLLRDPSARDSLRQDDSATPLLLKLLLSDDKETQKEAARLFVNFILDNSQNQDAVRCSRPGVSVVVEALSRPRSHHVQDALACGLAVLAIRDSAMQAAICDANGVPALLSILSAATASWRAKFAAASALARLCYSSGLGGPSRILDLVRVAGGLRVLTDMLLVETEAPVVEAAVAALKCLLENAENQKAAIATVSALFAAPLPDVQLLAVTIVRDIVTRHEELREHAVTMIGVPRLLQSLASPNEAVRTEALILFKSVFKKGQKVEVKPDETGLSSCIVLLQQSNDPSVLRLVLKIIKTFLKTSPQVGVDLAVKGAVPRIVAQLRQGDTILQRKALAILALMAQDAQSRDALGELDFGVVTQFLASDNQKLQRRACGIAGHLLEDPNRKQDVRKAGAAPIVKLLLADDIALLATALSLIQGFAASDNDSKNALLDAGLIAALEQVVRLYGDSELLLPALAILQSLTQNPRLESFLVQSNMLKAFEALLANPYPNPQARDALHKILSTVGYSTGVCTQAHREQPEANIQQDFYHCLTCNVFQPGGICEGCALVCHKGHKLSPKYRDHIVCSCGGSKPGVCASMALQKPVPPPLKICSSVFGAPKTARPQALFKCLTCWNDANNRFVCSQCAEACHKGHMTESLGQHAGWCACNDRVYQKCSLMELKKAAPAPVERKASVAPAAAAAAAPVPPSPRKADDKGDDAVCIICMDAPKEALFYKCGHIAACLGCAQGMKGKPCPICREPVLDVVKVFKI